MDRRNPQQNQQQRTPGAAPRPDAGQTQRGSQPQSGQRDASTHRSNTPNTPNRGR